MQEKKFEEAMEYLTNSRKIVEQGSMVVHSNHPVVDIVLSAKYAEAKEKDILVEIVLDDLEKLPLKEEEITVVLSNLMDNAIEASEKVKHNRQIKVKIQKDNLGYLLVVSNRIAEELQYENNAIVSTKENKEQHGFGIYNIECILKKYSYEYSFYKKNDWFWFVAELH